MWSCRIVLVALLVARFGGANAIRDVAGGRNLLGCTALSFSLASAHSEEKKSVGEAVVRAFAEAPGCGEAFAISDVSIPSQISWSQSPNLARSTQQAAKLTTQWYAMPARGVEMCRAEKLHCFAVLQANVKAIATAYAQAIAETSAKVEGDDCEPNSSANALASSNAIASAFAGAIADAESGALNEFASASSKARAEEFKETIKSATAKAGSQVIGTGEATNLAVAEVVAEAVAEAIAEAISEVYCEEGFDPSKVGQATPPAPSPPSSPSADPCACSDKSVINRVRTNRPGCKQHAIKAGDKGFFCYIDQQCWYWSVCIMNVKIAIR
ncbi:hypothetical protein BSKO_08267 [Bryopsis sp. KO-2023]|nr:hypothetical protein BSKO_08267 [Bryopsis sp. KO-2023]